MILRIFFTLTITFFSTGCLKNNVVIQVSPEKGEVKEFKVNGENLKEYDALRRCVELAYLQGDPPNKPIITHKMAEDRDMVERLFIGHVSKLRKHIFSCREEIKKCLEKN